MGWSYSAGQKTVNRVTVREREDATSILVDWWVDGRRKKRSLRSILGRPVTDRGEAIELCDWMATNHDLLRRQSEIGALFRRRKSLPRPSEVVGAPLDRLRVNSMPVDPLGGIYLLFFNGTVVYVGRSGDVLRRLYQHRLNAPFRFDEIAFIEVAERDRHEVERGLIERFRPIGNKDFNPDSQAA